MSNEDLSGRAGDGQFGAYVPPPPASSGRSPWLYVALGCGIFTLLIFGGCIGAGIYFGNKVKQQINKPLDKEALAKELSDVPIYPNAKLDEKTTKILQATTGFTKGLMKDGQSMAFAAYISADDDSQILKWYDKNMVGAGYKAISTQESESTGTTASHSFSKGDVVVVIQIPAGKSEDSFHILRMQGMGKSRVKAQASGD